MRIRVPVNLLETGYIIGYGTWGVTKRKREKRDALAYAIDITQVVALNDYDTGTLWIRYSDALNTNIAARVCFRNHVRRNGASVRDRGKSASRAEQWEVITSIGKKERMILSMQQNPPRFRYYVLFFPNHAWKIAFCWSDLIVPAFNSDIISYAKILLQTCAF